MNQKQLIERFQTLSLWLGAFSMLLGVGVVIGWILDLPVLKTVLPGFPTMKLNTAICFFLLGAASAMANLIERKRLRSLSGLIPILAGIAALIGGATIVEYALHLDLGIDQLLIADTELPSPLPPGRMSPITALICLLLGSGAVLLRFAKRNRAVAQAPILASLLLSSLAGLAYVFRAGSLSSSYPYSTMAIHTTWVAVLLSLSLLFLQPGLGVTSDIVRLEVGGFAARRSLPLSIGVLVLLGLIVRQGHLRQLYDPGTALVFVVFIGVILISTILWWNSNQLNEIGASQRAMMSTLEAKERDAQLLAHQLGLVVDHVPAGVALFDREMRYIWASERWVTDFDLTGKAYLGLSHYDLFPNLPERWKAVHRRSLAGAVERAEEDVFDRADGGVTWIRWEVRPWYDAQGAIGGLLIFSEDITQRKLSAEALKKSKEELEFRVRQRTEELERAHDAERQLRSQLESLSQASTAITEAVAALPENDLKSILYSVALQAQLITGAEYVAVGIGRDPAVPFNPWVTVGMPPDLESRIGRTPRPVGTLGAVAWGGHTIRVPEVTQHSAFIALPPGHPPMHSFLGVPIQFRGRPMGNLYVANKRNAAEFSIGDQRSLETLASRTGSAIEIARLYDSETQLRQWLQTVIDQMPEGVIILDAEGAVTGSNSAAKLMSGEVRAPSGTPLPWPETPLIQAFKRGESRSGVELLIQPASGPGVPVLASSSPIRNKKGAITGGVIVFQDISLRKEMERLREEWTSVIAHDLRQPVSSIELGAQLLALRAKERGDARDSKVLQNMRVSASFLNRAIGDLLDLSRIEAKRLALEPRPTVLGDLIRQIVDRLSAVTQGFQVRVQERGSGPAIAVDPVRIEQVVGNLLSNAAKYGTRGTEIRVEIEHFENQSLVSVTNEGPGIPAEDLSRLFTRFARTEETKRRGIQGIGLGLYICKGIVEAHGGKIWAESAPGAKTTFRFSLPHRQAEAASVERPGSCVG